MRQRLRRLFPPHGDRYELFDTSVLLFVLGLVAYVLTDPPMSTQQALPPLRFISEEALGWILAGAGAAGIVAAYSARLYRTGYVIATTVALVMAANFAIGAVDEWALRPVASAFFYGWIARRLMRDNGEAP